MQQIATGGRTHVVGPILAALLAVSPKTVELLGARTKRVKKTTLMVAGAQVQLDVSLDSVEIGIAVAKGLSVDISFGNDANAHSVSLSYSGRNGDLSDAMVEIGARRGTMREVLAYVPVPALPGFLDAFLDVPFVDSYDDLGHSDGDVVFLFYECD